MTWQAMASIAASGEADWNAARMRYKLDSLAFAFGCELRNWFKTTCSVVVELYYSEYFWIIITVLCLNFSFVFVECEIHCGFICILNSSEQNLWQKKLLLFLLFPLLSFFFLHFEELKVEVRIKLKLNDILILFIWSEL